MRLVISRYWIHAVVVIGLLIVAVPSLIAWFGFNSAMGESDTQAVEWLNEQEHSTYTCNECTAPWIYDRFVDKEYVETVDAADFVIVRDEPMTPRCDPENRYYVEGREADVEGLELLVEFDGVRIYKGAR